ncbi:hypothetical protein Dvina_10440 [Dactylosporangium vinaceum]|nr:hypothetical protein Dvina_10440 [Dactylosporangium vinaceum]
MHQHVINSEAASSKAASEGPVSHSAVSHSTVSHSTVSGLNAGCVVISRGADGLLAISGDNVWRAVPPAPEIGNPTGAGDACVAAIARGLRDRTPWPDLLADAVALSAAAVAAPVAGAVDKARYEHLRTRITVTSPDVRSPADRSEQNDTAEPHNTATPNGKAEPSHAEKPSSATEANSAAEPSSAAEPNSAAELSSATEANSATEASSAAGRNDTRDRPGPAVKIEELPDADAHR